MSKMKTLLSQVKSKKVIAGGIIIALVVVFAFRNKSQKADNFEVKRADFVKSVSVSGKVVSLQNVKLGFETGGTVARVYKNVGDKVYQGEVIVALDSSELQASRDKARADLLAEEAELQKLKSGESDATEVTTDKRLLVNSILDAYTKSDDAIRNKVDQFYDNPRTGPQIKYTFHDYFNTRIELNRGRGKVEDTLTVWQKEISNLTVSTYKDSYLSNSFANLSAIKKFLDLVSFAVNSFEESDNLSQSTVEKYKSDIALARSNINEAVSSLTSISNDLRSSISEIPVQEARIKAAQAEVRSFDAQIAKTVLIAPFSGIVSVQDAKVGESVSADTNIISVITNEIEIEAYVPEVSIVGINLQNKVAINVEAGPGILDFTGFVSHIDPAETERDGVSNYKIKVKPYKQDPILKSGMTADIKIETERRPDVLIVPKKFILEGFSKVLIQKNKKESEERDIEIGETDSYGNVEILSGLSEGEIIVSPVAVKK